MIQAFKNLTIVMAHKTNAGVTDGSKVTVEQGGTATASTVTDIEAFRLKGDLRYTPVVLKPDGLGYALAQVSATHGGGTEEPPTGAVIGVLMESFDRPMHEHEVMIHGVVGMKCKDAIKPGVPVFWDVEGKSVTSTEPTTANKGVYYVGLSLTNTAKADEYVDVLIGK